MGAHCSILRAPVKHLTYTSAICWLGTHVGGYDEFVFDITDAVAASARTENDGVPIAVLCDNSEDLERSPSDLSDFSLYGGLYRHVHLAYVPGVSLESVHIVPTWTPAPRQA